MKDIKEQLAEYVSQIIEAPVDATVFTNPPRVELGEFAFPCFILAKQEKTAPNVIAENIAHKLNAIESPLWEVATATGPYVNIKIRPEVWARIVLTQDTHNSVKKPLKIMVEYSQPNTHKLFHVGHVRNACLGASIVNILRYQGNSVLAATYVNDVGAHVAKCLWNLMNYHESDDLPVYKGKYLGEIYAEATERIGENQELKEEVSQVLQRLEDKEPEITALWAKTRQWSLDQFKGIYDEMHIRFDRWYYESDVLASGKDIVKTLLKKEIAMESDGAIIVDLTEYGLDVLVILKSDGTTLYATSDLALAFEKAKMALDESMYVVDVRQSLYFKQIFKTLECAGFTEKLVHIPYELVTLPEGSMSSRKGNIISYEDFRDTVMNRLVAETKERHPEWNDKKIQETAFLVCMAAIKFGMLKYENNNQIVFDMDAALSVEGATGPYLLYTIARINSIVKKVGEIASPGEVDFSVFTSKEEKEVLKHLSLFEDVVALAGRQKQPSYICTYLIELAQKFNSFYHQHSVLKAENSMVQYVRFILVKRVLSVLDTGMDLLNIETIKEM